MEFAPAPGVAQFNLIYKTNGGTAENVIHVHKDSGAAWTSAELNTMNIAIGAWEQATGRAQRASDVENIEIIARDLTVQNGTESTYGGEGFGLIAGVSAPDNVTIAIKKETGMVGRSFRGRLYWIGVPLSKLSLDSLDGTYVTNVVAACNSLVTAINAVTGFHMCLLRGQYNGSRLDPRQEAPITKFSTVDTYIDSQRRRLVGRGR